MTNVPDIWPTAEDLEDLVVTEEGDGSFTLSAPDETVCGQWLKSYEGREHELQAQVELALTNYLNAQKILHGEAQEIPDQQSGDRSGGQENGPGTVEEHQPGSDS